MPNPPEDCPCGSCLAYAECCQPFHCGKKKAPTAEVLMRSRFTAYVKGEVGYLVATTHPDRRRKGLLEDYACTYRSIQWLSLGIIGHSQGGPKDKVGKVEFKATYLQGGNRAIHHELSRFRRHNGDWHYVDGKVSDVPA